VLCTGTAGALLLLTMLLKKVDTRRPGQVDVSSSDKGGAKAA